LWNIEPTGDFQMSVERQSADGTQIAICAFSTCEAAQQATEELKQASFPLDCVHLAAADQVSPDWLVSMGAPRDWTAPCSDCTVVVVQAGDRFAEAVQILVRHGGIGPASNVVGEQSGIPRAVSRGADDATISSRLDPQPKSEGGSLRK
jgi:hypothetical protein